MLVTRLPDYPWQVIGTDLFELKGKNWPLTTSQDTYSEVNHLKEDLGRKIWTPIPQTDKHLVPEWTYLETFRAKNQKFKEAQRRNYNQRHKVWITSEGHHIEGRVTASAGPPRFYIVDTPSGQVHRNRHHLNVVPTTQDVSRDPPEQDTPMATDEPTVEPQETPAEPPAELIQLLIIIILLARQFFHNRHRVSELSHCSSIKPRVISIAPVNCRIIVIAPALMRYLWPPTLRNLRTFSDKCSFMRLSFV